jgi:hypothetical protein
MSKKLVILTTHHRHKPSEFKWADVIPSAGCYLEHYIIYKPTHFEALLLLLLLLLYFLLHGLVSTFTPTNITLPFIFLQKFIK